MSLEKAYKFYKEYGKLVGSDVRKAMAKKDSDGTIILKHFVCSKEGFNDIKIVIFDGVVAEEGTERQTVSCTCRCKPNLSSGL